VVEEDDRTRGTRFLYLDFVLTEIADWLSLRVDDAHVEAHELDARTVDRRRRRFLDERGHECQPETCHGTRNGITALLPQARQ